MKKQGITKLIITAIFVAILIVQSFIPDIGYVRILPTLPAITTIPLIIAIYGSLMGPKFGFVFGLIWGVTRLLMAYTQPGDMVSLILFQNFLISLIPSILAGWVPGLITKFLADKSPKIKRIGFIINGAATSLTNTMTVIILTSVLFMNNSTTLLKYLGNTSGSKSVFIVLITALGLNGVIEAIFTAILTPIIVMPLEHVMKRKRL